MKSTEQTHPKQLKVFTESLYFTDKPSEPLFLLPEDIQQRRRNQMVKFKPFHDFQKPLIGLTPESFLDYVETVIPKDHLSRLVKTDITTSTALAAACAESMKPLYSTTPLKLFTSIWSTLSKGHYILPLNLCINRKKVLSPVTQPVQETSTSRNSSQV